MKSYTRHQIVLSSSDCSFAFFGFDESNISDEVLSEGNVQTEIIRDSISVGHMDNTPIARRQYQSPRFGNEKQRGSILSQTPSLYADLIHSDSAKNEKIRNIDIDIPNLSKFSHTPMSTCSNPKGHLQTEIR
jgi:hypothetical protein